MENYWIQGNNGKKEQLGDFKHGVRKEQLDKKYHNLFDAYDVNKDGTLEENELDLITKGLSNFAGADKTLDVNENAQLASIFVEEAGIKDADFMGFVKSATKASEDIVSSTETQTSDGGKQIVTTYKDGTIETIAYYPNGEYKFKHTEKHVEKTTVTYSVQGNPNKQYTAEELDKKIKEEYNKEVRAYKKASAQSKSKDSPYSVSFVQNPGSYKDYKKDFMQRYNIVSNTNTSKIDIDNVELSKFAKQDAAVRDFVLSHFIETHKTTQENLDTMGMLDDIGAAINAGAGELFNACKNIYNKYFGSGTEEDYKNFYELVKKFEPNYDKAIAADGDLEIMHEHKDRYFSTFEKYVKDYDMQKGAAFQQKTEQYQQAQVLKQRIELLKKARYEVELYQNEQDALVYGAVNYGLNPASHIVNANNILLQCFDNDKEAVNLLLNGSLDGNEGNAASAAQIQALIDKTEKANAAVLGGKTFDEIKGEYNEQYKEMYGVDFVPDELNDKINDAKATGGMVKIAAITIVSILITRSPAMANIMGAAAGSEAASGAGAAFVRTLVSKYGQTVVQQGIKFAMTTGTLATDVGLTLLNQVTDNRDGVQWNEVGESAKGSAKFIYFGAYIGSPLAQAVSQEIGSLGLAGKLMSGGAKTTQGAITTTTISGEKLIQNFMNTSKSALATEIGAFSGLELATGDIDPTKVVGEQAEMLTQLKLMNHVIEYMLGGKVHTAIQKANMEAAIEKSGVKNWTVKEIKTPKGAQYTVEMDGVPLGRFESANDLASAMMGRVSMALKDVQGETTDGKTQTTEGQKQTSETEIKTVDLIHNVFEKTTGYDIQQTKQIDYKTEFESKFSQFVEDGSVAKMIKEFQQKYPNVDINELYSLPIFKFLDGTNRNVKLSFKRIIQNFESLKKFPYSKYGKYLEKLNVMQLVNLKLNEGISFEILDKYSSFFTKDNFGSLLSGLTTNNIKYLDKYISEGKINTDNIKNVGKFDDFLDKLINKWLEKDSPENFNKIINYKITDRHREILNKYEQFIDASNIFKILNKSEVYLPDVERTRNIPKELFGTIITKDNFIKMLKVYGLDKPLLEYGENFDKVNWDKYRKFAGKIELTQQVIDMMARGIDEETLNYMCKKWPVASHAGEEAPFDTYFYNPKLLNNSPYMTKLEIYEQCCQKDMIKHAKGNLVVFKMFKELKTKLEQELKNPVKIVNVDKKTINNFLKAISNSSENDMLIRRAERDAIIKQSLENAILNMFPELKIIINKPNFTDELIKVVNSEEYLTLKDCSKFTLKLACIMTHLDPNIAYSLLEKINLSHGVKRQVLELIDYENLLKFNKFHLNEQYIATIMNTKEKLSMLDLYIEAVSGNKLEPQKKQLILNFQNQINQTGIPLFPTVLPRGKSLEKIPKVEYNGVEYQVLDLTKIKGELSRYGFATETTVENFTIDATFVRNIGEAETIRLISNPNYAGVPSSTKIGLGQNGTFEGRIFGVPFEVTDKNDYILASDKDTDIGHGVRSQFIATDKIFDNYFSSLKAEEIHKRNMLAEKVRKDLGLSKEQYAELYAQIIDKKYFSQIKTLKIDGQEVSLDRLTEIINVLKKVQFDIVNNKEYKGTHNETNIRKPDVNKNFIIAKVDDISEIPQEWLDYAKTNNLKFIILGSIQENNIHTE